MPGGGPAGGGGSGAGRGGGVGRGGGGEGWAGWGGGGAGGRAWGGGGGCGRIGDAAASASWTRRRRGNWPRRLTIRESRTLAGAAWRWRVTCPTMPGRSGPMALMMSWGMGGKKSEVRSEKSEG